ncbi:AraC family transcriptional regulator [Bifidobacterium reuteri]|uniref:AraC family transcriptional regulator n=1 Tax=Bifidobacterium reuteri TaxID=983706 RepID=A0A5J5E9H1_9BIFI|nr:AraC family transcriptional regulator [Bifidobacterium reuteri]KAA8825787.1 AraC family transcriptional regulator [Bifidobacterium reuteri]
MGAEERIGFLGELIAACHDLRIHRIEPWPREAAECDSATAQNGEETVVAMLSLHGYRSEENRRHPVFVTDEHNLTCIAVYDPDGKTVYTLGPFFLSLPTEDCGVCAETLSFTQAVEYAIMLQYAASLERVDIDAFEYLGGESGNRESWFSSARPHGTYELEQEMLRQVREGDVEAVRRSMTRITLTGRIGKLGDGDPLRQAKNAAFVGLVLFSRAAIEGGVPPEISYDLTDHYFQLVEQTDDFSELRRISQLSQRDFVERVRRARIVSEPSKAIALCKEYIEMHLEDGVTLRDVADVCGYAPYYLSRKFKAAEGLTLKRYIDRRRLVRAEFLLRTSSRSIRDIAQGLGYSSASHFAEIFHAAYAMTPGDFRAHHRS